jgi:hypothetical protein
MFDIAAQREDRTPAMVGTAALAVAAVACFGLFLFGRRFSRRFAALNRTVPPPTWMFRRTGDVELEGARRKAQIALQVAVAALAVYLFMS